ncbi:MAG: trypsin-like serine protease, partial [Alphaproteobacteria bacterium]
MTSLTKYLTAFSISLVLTTAATTPSQAITGGKLAKTGELPFMRRVETYFPSYKGLPGVCSSALISEQLVLTAAHCVISVEGEKGTGIRIATSDSNGKMDPQSIYKVTDVYYPQGYLENIKEAFDIAILKLEQPIPNAVFAKTLLSENYLIYKKDFEEILGTKGDFAPGKFTFEKYLREEDDDFTTLFRAIPKDAKGSYIVHAAGYGRMNCLKINKDICEKEFGTLRHLRLRLSQLSSEKQPNGLFKISCKEIGWGGIDSKPFCYALNAQSLVDAPSKVNDKLDYGQNVGDSGGPLFTYVGEKQEPMIIGVSSGYRSPFSEKESYQYNVSLEVALDFLRGFYDPEG